MESKLMQASLREFFWFLLIIGESVNIHHLLRHSLWGGFYMFSCLVFWREFLLMHEPLNPKKWFELIFFSQFQYIFMQTCDTKFSHCNLRKCMALSFENLKLILGFSKKERSLIQITVRLPPHWCPRFFRRWFYRGT